MLKSLRNSVALAGLAGCLWLTAPALAQSDSELAVRMSQVEDQLRQLMGQVEQLTYELRQLKAAAGQTNTGAAETAPAKKLASREPVEGDGGTIDVQELSLTPPGDDDTYTKTVVNEDGSESQVTMKKAPGPKILGTLGGSGTSGSGSQLPPSQQDGVGEITQGDVPAEDVETVALAQETPESLYERSNESLLRRQFGEAEAGFRTFLEKYPEHGLAGNAQYWLGETYLAQDDYRQAAQAFLRGYQQYPGNRRAADSLLKLGISLGRLGQKDQACASYAAVDTEFPKAVEARKRAQAEAKRAGCQT
ncbi:MAG: tol-pal system protein YbgF [Alphaproteobacteria bacterium]|nr:tol-pal system protein YbgF [Alphaproteobacteria bacterium]